MVNVDHSQPATGILPKQTRAERRQELYGMLRLPEGYRFLAILYRHHFPADEAQALPTVQEMIARVLSNEYPA